MDPCTTAELQSLRAELRRTRRALLLLFLGLVGFALSAQAPGGLKELRADRLVIGTPENGIVLEVSKATGPTIHLAEGRASAHVQTHGGASVVQLLAPDPEGTTRTVEALAGGPATTGLWVRDEDMKNGAERQSRMGVGGLEVISRPAQGKVKVLATVP